MFRHILITILVAAAVSFGTYKLTAGDRQVKNEKRETAYERVMRSGILRCGYALYPPHILEQDANTGKVYGAMVEIIEEMAKSLSLKVEWTEETGWGTWTTAMNAGRFDAFCPTAYQNAARGREVIFTRPIYYHALHGYARIDDNRFDNDIAVVNDPSIRISAMDGEVSDWLPRRLFPEASFVSLPQLAQFDQLMLNVTSRKADIVFNEQSLIEGFLAKNPGTLKRVTKEPLQIYNASIPVAKGEYALRDMLDSAIVELAHQGTIDRILMKYGATPDVFLRPAKPYQD